jgi:CheY-like chemotaxis protein
MDKPPKILLVEDDPNDVELTLSALRDSRLGNEVVVVHDGEDALGYLYRRGTYEAREKANPAVVLLDLKLPKVDGLEVLKQVKSDPRLRTIPIVILTSSREEPDLLRGYDLGANAYVVKPVDFEQFTEAMRQLGLFWAVINVPPPHSAADDEGQ